jgi:hypothetical protein
MVHSDLPEFAFSRITNGHWRAPIPWRKLYITLRQFVSSSPLQRSYLFPGLELWGKHTRAPEKQKRADGGFLVGQAPYFYHVRQRWAALLFFFFVDQTNCRRSETTLYGAEADHPSPNPVGLDRVSFTKYPAR